METLDGLSGSSVAVGTTALFKSSRPSLFQLAALCTGSNPASRTLLGPANPVTAGAVAPPAAEALLFPSQGSNQLKLLSADWGTGSLTAVGVAFSLPAESDWGRDAGFVAVMSAISKLRDRPENWNGNQVEAPRREAVSYAARWFRSIEKFFSHLFIAPLVSSDEFGEVSLEWWRHTRKLTVYIGEQEISYVKVWGDDVELDMESGEIHSTLEFGALWSWLSGGR